MADPNPTMTGHLDHGSWGMTLTTVTTGVAPGTGSYTIGVCDVCHLMIAECNHEANDWRTESDGEGGERQVLRCRLCGIDGT